MKSDNTKGNPFHDEEGKFTSGEKSVSKETEEKLGQMGFGPDKKEKTVFIVNKENPEYKHIVPESRLSDIGSDWEVFKNEDEYKETMEWRADGYKEIMVDPLDEVYMTLRNYIYEPWGRLDSFEVDLNDYVDPKKDIIDFYKSDLTDEEKQVFLETGFIPRRVFDAENDGEYFAEFLKNKHERRINEDYLD